MNGSDRKKFVGFTTSTLSLSLVGVFFGKIILFFVLNNELGDIYWGIIIPIFAFVILIIIIVTFTSYTASWIYYVKTKGRSRWFGLLGLIPVLGPLVIIFLKNKASEKNQKKLIIRIFLVANIIIPIVLFFLMSFMFSSLEQEIQKINQTQYQSESKINAVVKGATQKR
ncbi:MAG: hypothetical protein PF549_01210 [Patescibacteria group bacterium]|jgi:uncharacterized membrane protein|nr:hypothetical protein [Patescibacteria group bacterium]